MNELELILIVCGVGWLICSWKLALGWLAETARKGWREEMRKEAKLLKETSIKTLKETFLDDEEKL